MKRLAPFLPDRSHLRPLAALAVLAFSGWISAWGWGGTDRRAGDAARELAEAVRSAAQPIRLALRNGLPETAAPAEANARSLLAGLDKAATRAGVQVTRVTPRPAEPGVVNVELLAEYGQTVRFIADCEALGSTIRNLQIGAPAGTAPQARQVVTFSLEAGARPLRQAGLAGPDDVPTAELTALHPFQSSQTDRGEQDLSDRYHLTGITRIGAELMATIDGRDYETGDPLGEMVIVRISEAEVHLSGPGGGASIRFRHLGH